MGGQFVRRIARGKGTSDRKLIFAGESHLHSYLVPPIAIIISARFWRKFCRGTPSGCIRTLGQGGDLPGVLRVTARSSVG